MAFLECKDVYKVYAESFKESKVPALRGVELTADEGELIAIIGPSGSGKSTLIKMIGAIEYPTSGNVILGETEITKLSKSQRARFRRDRIGFLYQFPDQNLLWNLSALKNIIFPMKLTGILNRTEKKKRALQLLKDVGLENRKNHKPYQLSGGEAQRLGIAVALANNPDVILADEPTGELDSLTTVEIIDYFKSLNRDLGKTFIVVTHDTRFAKMTHRTLRIMDGRIVSLHRAKLTKKPIEEYTKAIEEDEVFLFVDEQGNMRLPKEIRNVTGIKDYVKIEIRDGIACLLPKDEEEKKS
ncbi:MAG: ATP-binding cassette domain-containing protein [Candidatus Hodarchaeales archaeon]|jgi:ABC-type lipoprotein export system ATPase subunit